MSDFQADVLGAGDAGSGARPRRANKFPRFTGRRGPTRPEQPLEYKNIEYLCRFVTPQGKIQHRKRSGFSGQDQRKLGDAIKLARFMALMPYVGRLN